MNGAGIGPTCVQKAKSTLRGGHKTGNSHSKSPCCGCLCILSCYMIIWNRAGLQTGIWRNKECIVMRLDGYGLFVKDMAAMIRFYRDVLGFEIKEDENTDNVYLLKDGTLFLLYGRKDFEKLTSKRYEYLTGVNAHSEMALYVDTYEEVDMQYKNAVDHGAASLLEPTTEPWGQRTCFIADPEGNIIEIGSWNKPYEIKDL